MKKKLQIFTTIILFLIQVPLLAQVADTVLVPSTDNVGQVDALARFVLGDTTATGERNNINRVYKLTRGDIYLLAGRIYCEDFPLVLIADDDETQQPPVIAPFPLDDGSIPRITFYLYQGGYFKNLYIQGVAPNGQRNSSDRPVSVMGSNIKFTMVNCIVEGFKSAGVFNGGTHNSIFINDCKWRNNNWTGIFTGQFFFNSGSGDIPMDTVSIVNNTFFLGSSYFMCTNRQYVDYVRFEHNTLFVNYTNPFYAPYVTNADIKNNLFFSPCAVGETASERVDGYYDWDGERESVFSVDTLPSDLASTYGITDATRRVVFSNNAYFWPQVLKDYWTNNADVDAPVWINDRTSSFFNNDAQYPNMIEENNREADPGFNAEVTTLVDSMMNYVELFRAQGSAIPYFYNPSGESIFPARWPIPEDLSYSNTDLLTAGDDGLPLGDLNWFPEQKGIWENGGTDVEDINSSLPLNFSLQQNYPNPFNPTTLIQFQVPESGYAKLKVYDILGREVAVLIDKELNAGSYKVDFNASNLSSGTYFYRLEAGKYSSVKKMLLVK